LLPNFWKYTREKVLVRLPPVCQGERALGQVKVMVCEQVSQASPGVSGFVEINKIAHKAENFDWILQIARYLLSDYKYR